MLEALARSAAEIVDLALVNKPELIIQNGNLPGSAEALRDLLATSGRIFDRGVPARFVNAIDGGIPCTLPMTKNNVVMEAHKLCQPMKIRPDGEHFPVTLPERLAQMYLDMSGEWNLPPLAGISLSPLLTEDGSFRVADGYDLATTLWCCHVPELSVPDHPSQADAQAALGLIRQAFRTFPFSDAFRLADSDGLDVVDTALPPGQDESAFLVALLTACCRPSLWLAPGLLLNAPTLSGAGTGKGLLVRAICAIAFGIRPRAFTSGNDRHELDKRLVAELVEAQPVLFLDNANGVALRSDTLASVLTERPARVRVLGQTRMVPLNSTAFMAVTGNGLTVAEDLARRFICCELDARCEDPEARAFPGGFLEEIEQQRAEFLAALLMIWRWGRQNASSLKKGRPLGSFERWAAWCRDPLITLGCQDPVERIESLKAKDPQRQRVAELFSAWWERHGDTPMKANDLAEEVKAIADAQGRGRQYLASYLLRLAGTHAAGFVLSRQEGAGKWNGGTYALRKIELGDGIGHRTHRTLRAHSLPEHGGSFENLSTAARFEAGVPPMSPTSPMPYATEGHCVAPGSEGKE